MEIWTAALVGTVAGAAVAAAALVLRPQRRAELESAQSMNAMDAQSLLVQALSNAIDGIALFDHHSRLLICNDRYRALLRPVAHLIQPGTHIADIIRAVASPMGMDSQWVERRMADVHQETEDELFLDGRWLLVRSFPTLEGGCLRTIRDISEAKQTQTSLEGTVAWLKGVMNTVADGIITIDESGTVLSLNTAAEWMFGYRTDEVVGRNVSMLMPEPHRGQHDSYLQSYLDSGIRRIIGTGREVPGRRGDGSVFPMEVMVSEMRDEDGVTFIGVVRDITQRKRADMALIQGEARFRAQVQRLQAIIDNMPQGLAVFDGDDTLVALNTAALRMLGLPEGEIRPGAIDISLFMTLLAASDCPQGEEAVRLTSDLAENIRERPEMVFEHRAESGMVMEVRSSSMPSGGLILSFTDITDRKNTELTLRQAKDEAERGNRAKNTFLANISHELRTPLNAIIGFSEMMRHEIFGPLEPSNYRSYVDDIHDSGLHLLDLINDILDMSKAEAGMTDLQEEPVDVSEIIHATMRLMERRAHMAGVGIHADLAPDLPPLLADLRRIRQVMLNLLSNAVKFSDDGGQVDIRARLDQDGKFVIAICDNGIGMSPEDLIKVMEPFVQADSRLSRKYEGSGLGLPLTKLLVHAHGGNFSLESRPGTGTTATVTFPASRVLPFPTPSE